MHEVYRPTSVGLGQRRQWVFRLIESALRLALLELKAVTIVYPLGALVVLDKAFALQYKMHARATEAWTLLEQILHPIEDLVVLGRLFPISNCGTIRTHYLAGPTLAGAEGFLNKLDGFALVVRP